MTEITRSSMKPSKSGRPSQNGAFTLIELLVVICILALLAAVRLPSGASAKTKSLSLQCLSNVRQLIQGGNLYAADFNDYLPPVWIDPTVTGGPVASHGFNSYQEYHYGRYVYGQNYTSNFGGPDPAAPFKVNSNNVTPYFQNLGYLYPLGLAGDGKIFYCPAYGEKSDPAGLDLSAAHYGPLLTTDALGAVRSSYIWNPWSVGAGRLYPKTTDFKSPHVLLNENLINSSSSPIGPLDPLTVDHDRSRRLTVAYSDQSVQQIRITTKMWAHCCVGSPTATFYCGSDGVYPNYGNFLREIEAER